MAKREMPSAWEQMRANEAAKQMGIIPKDAAEPRTASKELIEQMASKGRSVSVSGDFRTRPGAPLSALDNAGARTAELGRGGMTNDNAWNSIFGDSQKATKEAFGYNALSPTPRPIIPSLAPTVSGDAAAMANTWGSLPKAPAPTDYLSATLKSVSDFSQKLFGGAPVPAGVEFSGLKYQKPGTVGRVDSGRSLDASRGFMDRLKRDNQVLKSGPHWI